jgi:shikimate kinase
MRPLLVLVGPPGAGKSTVGRQVADRVHVAFRDTDRDVEQAVGKRISDIFIDDGEVRFRELEESAVAAALSEHDGVLSLGGGAVLSSRTRELLAGHRVVMLDVDLAAASGRIGLNRDRPVLALNPRATLKTLLDERMPFYLEVAGRVVPTSGRSITEVVDDVAQDLVPHT